MLLLSVWSALAGLSKLEALSLIESGDNDRAVGKAGEVSRYQIMPVVWRCYTTSKAYANATLSTTVARQHLTYLETLFQKRTGRAPTDFDRYVLWNAGPTYYARIGFTSSRVHPVIRERANRYVNLRQMPDEARNTKAAAALLAVGGLGP